MAEGRSSSTGGAPAGSIHRSALDAPSGAPFADAEGMKRPFLVLLAATAAALLALPAAALGTALPAFAVQAVAHGQGVFWAKDHTSWIGDYALDDGRSGYCIDVEKPPPTGAGIDYADGSESGWFSADDSARLAYLSRHWGSPGDPLTAAAGQLATWTVTGLADRKSVV